MIEPAIQIHPMVPLAKASAILKISRDELINRLSQGELLGEKRRIGESKKDSWFIYAAEFNRLLAQAVAQYEARVSTAGLEQFFTPGSGQPEAPVAPGETASHSPPVVAETVAIEPVAFQHGESDPAEIVDALGTNYALGSDYDTSDSGQLPSGRTPAEPAGTGLQIDQAMVTQVMQLVQHLQDERQSAEALKVRLAILEDEMDQLRKELLARPDSRSHSPFSRLKTYFSFLVGKST